MNKSCNLQKQKIWIFVYIVINFSTVCAGIICWHISLESIDQSIDQFIGDMYRNDWNDLVNKQTSVENSQLTQNIHTIKLIIADIPVINFSTFC